MKVQCDVCRKEEASLFCYADEAALCTACDRRVHRANKLAGKHRRLSLITPSSAHRPPLCDVCQEKRAFVFCQEDRAILCRECDAPIHAANHLTMGHSRFLLTGVKLSSNPIPSCPSEEAELHDGNTSHTNTAVSKSNENKVVTVDKEVSCTTTAASATTSTTTDSNNSSSISEYLTKMLPGWRVEDLLVDDAMDGFSQNDELPAFLDADVDGGGLGVAVDEFHIWMPHVPQAPPQCYSTTSAASGGAAGYYHQGLGAKELSQSQHQLVVKTARERWSDDAFRVPQISPPLRNDKRPRPSAGYF